jgi:wobble nucleotide-excising tRNase
MGYLVGRDICHRSRQRTKINANYMIETIQLLRNLGQFDSVDAGRQIPISKIALVYAENGRGKTTLAAVLRSLGNGDPTPINERRRLGSTNPPHVVINGSGNTSALFQDGTWQCRLGNIMVFDDTFVSENICSGMKVETDHRQNLHELIIGSQGVVLNKALQACVERIEQHNRDLQQKGNAIPSALRGDLSIEAFCALEPRDGIEDAIQEGERNLAAGRQADEIQRYRLFASITLPEFNVAAIQTLLSHNLQNLESSAVRKVQEHLSRIGEGGEDWVALGMTRIRDNSCPFCEQDLSGSALISHYQAYFSQEYSALRDELNQSLQRLSAEHSGEVVAAFERSVAHSVQTQQFWSRFARINEVTLDTADIALAWKTAFEKVRAILQRKQLAPLDPLALTNVDIVAIAAFHRQRQKVVALNEALLAANREINLVKERAASANIASLERDLMTLRLTRNRVREEAQLLCNDYLDEKRAKTETEQQRDRARVALDTHRRTVFPSYQTLSNNYLQRFNAGFRLASVSSVNNRGGSSCNYTVLINAHEVPLTDSGSATPCFKNTMSSGDRNTLALAFFFASLDAEPNLDQIIVVIDDPMTSLDEHRSLATIQEIRRLSEIVGQLVILSHSKPFLCAVWEGLGRNVRSAMRIARANQASTLASWDVNQDCISEHDRRHDLVSRYIANSVGINEGEVATALRPILESFMRVAYPSHFPPGSLLGHFIGRCEQREGTAEQIMSPRDRTELKYLVDYCNRFHHDTNPAWQTVIINDHELLDFTRRTLAFTSK